jgi:hypothetical protein
VVETAVGRITGHNSGHFRSGMATPEVLNCSTVHGDRFYSHQNCSCIGFGRCATANTPSARGVVQSSDNIGFSKVDRSQYGMETV